MSHTIKACSAKYILSAGYFEFLIKNDDYCKAQFLLYAIFRRERMLQNHNEQIFF